MHLDPHSFIWSAFVNSVIASHLVPRSTRRRLLRAAGITIGERGKIGPQCRFIGSDVTIGDRVLLNAGVFIDASAHVEIGPNCWIAPEVMILTTSHQVGSGSKRAGREVYEPVTVEEGCWLGARAVLLPGVKVGHGCVVAAGAVVRDDCQPNGLYAGVPAIRKRELA
jgi:maltose O-acetyltransferase